MFADRILRLELSTTLAGSPARPGTVEHRLFAAPDRMPRCGRERALHSAAKSDAVGPLFPQFSEGIDDLRTAVGSATVAGHYTGHGARVPARRRCVVYLGIARAHEPHYRQIPGAARDWRR